MTAWAPLPLMVYTLSLCCASGRTPVPAVLPSAEEVPAAAGPASSPPAAPPSGPHAATEPLDFNLMVRPILEANCRPCHFEGGKMYERLPFDRAETVRSLGEALFTRIEDEREQAVIRSFLAGAEAAPAASP